MTETTYTPGPWVFDHEGGAEDKFPHLDGVGQWGTVRGPDGYPVATATLIDSIADQNAVRAKYYADYDNPDRRWTTPPKTLANARLIAKAPELLEALEDTVFLLCLTCPKMKEKTCPSKADCNEKNCPTKRYKNIIAAAKGAPLE